MYFLTLDALLRCHGASRGSSILSRPLVGVWSLSLVLNFNVNDVIGCRRNIEVSGPLLDGRDVVMHVLFILTMCFFFERVLIEVVWIAAVDLREVTQP